jgi:chromosome segregation ATPase
LAEKNRADIEISGLKVQITEINEQQNIYLTRIDAFNRDIEPKNFRLNDLEELLKVTKTKLQSSQQKEVSLFKANNQLEIKNSDLKRLNDDNIERKNLELEKRKTDLAFIAELESLLEQAKELRLETELKYGKSENLLRNTMIALETRSKEVATLKEIMESMKGQVSAFTTEYYFFFGK